MQYECTVLALFGPFRALDGPAFANEKRVANEMFLKASISLGNLLHLHQASYGSFCGPSGIIHYASWCVSALLDYTAGEPKLQGLVHEATVLLMNFSFRLKLGKGLLRVTRERMSKLPKGVVLPETLVLLEDFERKYWKSEYERTTNSSVPEFALASRELLQRSNIKPFQLTQLLNRVWEKDKSDGVR